MNEHKIKRAERLFDAIGEIDDRIIAEAEAPYAKPKARFGFSRIATIAASLVVCVGIFAGVTAMLSKVVVDEDKAESEPKASSTLASTLYSNRNNSSILKLSANDIDLFGGRTSIIWKYDGDSDYRVVYVPERKVGELRKELLELDSAEKLSFEEAETISCSIWVCDGEGTVVSPYLEVSDGNVGYGTLFDYSPEIEPTEDVNYLISDLIS